MKSGNLLAYNRKVNKTSIKEDVAFLNELGDYLRFASREELNDSKMLSLLGDIVNKMYFKIIKENRNTELHRAEDSFIDVISSIYALQEEVLNPKHQTFSKEFYKRIMLLGRDLSKLGNILWKLS